MPTPAHPYVVVGVDGGPSGEHALRWALSSPAFGQHLVHAVLVIPPAPSPVGGLDGLCVVPDNGEHDEFSALEIGRAHV